MNKIRFIFAVALFLLVTPFYKFFELGQDKDRFLVAGKSRSQFNETINLPRKKILDRNGNELAVSILRSTLLFRSAEEKDLGLTYAKTVNEPIFLFNSKRIYFENQLTPEFIKELKEFCDCFVISEPIYRRYYPYGSIISPLIGFSGISGGLEGLERSFDASLMSDQRSLNFFRDAKGRRVKGDLKNFIERSSQSDLTLTVDINLQFKLFEELKKTISAASAKGGFAVIMDANNGALLALANYPTFNPNRSDRVVHRNLLFDEYLEPGSLIKPITIAGAFSNGIISEDSLIDTNPGYINLSGFKRGEAGGKNHGVLSPSEIISNSSQVGIAKISIMLSRDQIIANLRDFGIGKGLDLNWYGIDSSFLYDSPILYDIDKASLGYGYLLRANIVQIARAYSAFANNGEIVEPRITIDQAVRKSKAIDSKTAKYILASLRSTVLEGTANKVSDSIVSIAGKTGTTEKYIVGNGYTPGKYISSFASIFPYENPKYIMVVSIDEPDPNNYFGGDISAPLVATLAEHMLINGYIK
ncbi:MAG: penicillin-binding protein 2 [SAR86 cluster bacterium]|nr:penicillin-binding protein 2 [SAR86 cluster bacterium]